MAKNALRRSVVTVNEIEARLDEALIPPAPTKQGLASLAGGWEGSEDLADLIEAARRASRSRST
jgi:hypothetical protein